MAVVQVIEDVLLDTATCRPANEDCLRLFNGWGSYLLLSCQEGLTATHGIGIPRDLVLHMPKCPDWKPVRTDSDCPALYVDTASFHCCLNHYEVGNSGFDEVKELQLSAQPTNEPETAETLLLVPCEDDKL